MMIPPADSLHLSAGVALGRETKDGISEVPFQRDTALKKVQGPNDVPQLPNRMPQVRKDAKPVS